MGMPKVWVFKDTTFFAKYKINNWAVAFDANGGTGEMPPVSHDEGIFMLPECKFTPPPNSHFIGWSLSATGEVIPAAFIDLIADTILYAKWAKDTFTITFYANGGTGTKNPVEVPYGEYTLPAVPYHYPGKKNIGWAYTPTGKYIDTETIFVDKDINLYAVYQSIYISFNANGGTGTMPTIELTDDKYYLPQCKFGVPAKNQEFVGWAYEKDGEVITTEYIEPDKDTTLYARWEVFYSVTLAQQDDTERIKTIVVHKSEDYKFTLPTETPFPLPDGYQLAGWSYEADGEIIAGKEIVLTEDIILYGICNCKVSLMSNGGIGDPQEFMVRKGHEFTLPEECPFTPQAKYRFLGWGETPTATGTIAGEVIVSKPVSYYAIWELYVVRVWFLPNGGIGRQFYYEVELGPYELPENTFFGTREPNIYLGWSYAWDGEVIKEKTVEITKETTFYARYRPVQVSFDKGIGSGEMATVSLTSYTYAWPEPEFTDPAGWYFKGWSLTPGGAIIVEETIYLTEDTTLYANYSPIPTTFYHYMPNGGIGEEFINQVGTYRNTPIYKAGVFQPPDDNHYMAGWYINDFGFVSNPPDIRFASTQTGHRYFYAVWREINCTVRFDPNGATGFMEDVVMRECDYTLPRCTFAPPEGYYFIGWSRTPDGEILPSPYHVIESQTLYARWQHYNQWIVWTLGEGTGDQMPTRYQNADTWLTIPGCPYTPPVGKIFSYWHISGLGNYGPGRQVKWARQGEHIATPIYVDYNHTITFDANGGVGEMDPVIIGDRMEFPLPECTFTPPVGKEFDRWTIYDDGSLVPDPLVVKSDITLKALWKVSIRTINFDSNGGFGYMEDLIVPVGTFISESPDCAFDPPDTPFEPVHFIGWGKSYGGPFISFPYQVMEDQTFYAMWGI